jgi:hypothetical protein
MSLSNRLNGDLVNSKSPSIAICNLAHTLTGLPSSTLIPWVVPKTFKSKSTFLIRTRMSQIRRLSTDLIGVAR